STRRTKGWLLSFPQQLFEKVMKQAGVRKPSALLRARVRNPPRARWAASSKVSLPYTRGRALRNFPGPVVKPRSIFLADAPGGLGLMRRTTPCSSHRRDLTRALLRHSFPMFDNFSAHFMNRDARSTDGLSAAYDKIVRMAAERPGPYFEFGSYSRNV